MMNTDPDRKKLKTDDNDVISHEHTATESEDEKPINNELTNEPTDLKAKPASKQKTPVQIQQEENNKTTPLIGQKKPSGFTIPNDDDDSKEEKNELKQEANKTA